MSKSVVLRHRDGSRKALIHAMFDAKGPEAARRYAKRLKIRDSSVNSWFSQFRKHANAMNVKELCKALIAIDAAGAQQQAIHQAVRTLQLLDKTAQEAGVSQGVMLTKPRRATSYRKKKSARKK